MGAQCLGPGGQGHRVYVPGPVACGLFVFLVLGNDTVAATEEEAGPLLRYLSAQRVGEELDHVHVSVYDSTMCMYLCMTLVYRSAYGITRRRHV